MLKSQATLPIVAYSPTREKKEYDLYGAPEPISSTATWNDSVSHAI